MQQGNVPATPELGHSVHVEVSGLRSGWESPVVGTEFAGTSISSAGDGQPIDDLGRNWLAANPHMRFYNAQRGYVSCRVTPRTWQSDYRVVPYVTRQDATIETAGSFVVEAGRPGALPA